MTQQQKAFRLKLASVILLWYGTYATFLIIAGLTNPSTYHSLPLMPVKLGLPPAYLIFLHVPHILAGYWLAKGTRNGAALGIVVGLYEAIGLVISPFDFLFGGTNIPVRIVFAIVIALIISGRKDLAYLRSSRWRPWSEGKRYRSLSG